MVAVDLEGLNLEPQVGHLFNDFRGDSVLVTPVFQVAEVRSIQLLEVGVFENVFDGLLLQQNFLAFVLQRPYDLAQREHYV